MPQLSTQSQHLRSQIIDLDLLFTSEASQRGTFLLEEGGVVEFEAGRVGEGGACGLWGGRGGGGELDW